MRVRTVRFTNRKHTCHSGVADVAAAARDAGHPRYRMIRADEISIAYLGVPSFSRHVCAFQGESGKITKAWYAYLD